MSVKYSGTLSRSKGIFDAINKNLKQVNLKGVRRVTVTFDPFKEDVKHTRYVGKTSKLKFTFLPVSVMLRSAQWLRLYVIIFEEWSSKNNSRMRLECMSPIFFINSQNIERTAVFVFYSKKNSLSQTFQVSLKKKKL